MTRHTDKAARYELRMTREELRRWRKLAAQAGESFATWWRTLAREAEAKATAELERR